MTGRLVLQEATVKYSYPGRLPARWLFPALCVFVSAKWV